MKKTVKRGFNRDVFYKETFLIPVKHCNAVLFWKMEMAKKE